MTILLNITEPISTTMKFGLLWNIVPKEACQTLCKKTNKHLSKFSNISENQIATVLEQMLKALDYMHK